MTNQTAQATPDLPLDMIIFGGGGDLSARKLLPALYMAHLHCNLPADTRILAIGRKNWTRDDYVAFMEQHLLQHKMINKEDLNIFKVMDEPEEIVEYIKRFVIL